MHSGDTYDVSATDIVVYFSINEVGMEQLVQAAVGLQPLVEDLPATNNYVLNNEEELV
jgi:hypothetical protein